MRRTLTTVLRAWAGQLENGVLGPEKESPEEAEPSSMVRRTATLGGGGAGPDQRALRRCRCW